MASSFPNGLDSFTDPLATDTLDDPDHAILHADINDAVEKLQAKVGVDGSAVASSLDALVRSAMPIGSLTAYVGTSAPDASWVVCDGSAISRSTYGGLFALVGTQFGAGNGTTTFNVPDLRGRVIAGVNAADAAFDVVGETGGAATHVLSESEIPSHSHGVAAHSHSINHDHASVTSGAGGSHSHSINHDHASVTSGSGGVAHTHSITHDHAAATSAAGSSHTHSGSFGSSSHRHAVEMALHDYYYKAAGENAAMKNWGVANNGVGWPGEYVQNSSWTSVVNSNASYATVAHRIHGSTGSTGTPTANASVSAEASHTHSVNLPSHTGTSGAASATSHTHSVDLPSFTGTSGAESSHTHSVDLPNFTGTSGSTSLTTDATGGGSAHNNLQPYMALNWLIKAA